MQYGLKKTTPATTLIMVNSGDFISRLFVGPGGVNAKTWKTRKGAQRAAAKLYGNVEIFTITDTMNY